jgi:hypothetical protein
MGRTQGVLLGDHLAPALIFGCFELGLAPTLHHRAQIPIFIFLLYRCFTVLTLLEVLGHQALGSTEEYPIVENKLFDVISHILN